MTTGVLLLAAGSSERFGSDKRLAELADGNTLLMSCIETINSSGLPLLTCLGASDLTLQASLQRVGSDSILCQESALGMGATLAEGVSARPTEWDAIIIALADMPWVRPSTFRQVAQSLEADTIVTPCFQDKRGNPVGFGRRFFPELELLRGDFGAKTLLERHASSVQKLAVEDSGIHRDIDTRAMLQGI